jgi:DNA-binding transcriptional LysR family regulator
MSDPDLRDLDAFVAVARTRNFRRAALEQGVSVSSLSQRLRDMEERLGIRLMNRTTRSVALTEAGELLLARVGPAMCDVGDALDQVRSLRGVPSGRLRINAPPPAIDLVLAPTVAPFLKAHPQIDLEIVSDSTFVDIVATGFDAGVRYGEHLAQDMIAVPLSPPQRYAVVASPQYIAQHGRPKHPKDLLNHVGIRIRFGSGAIPDWEFEKAGRVVKVAPPGRLIANYPGLARRSMAWASGRLSKAMSARRSSPARWSACSMIGARRFRDRSCIIRADDKRRRRSQRSSPLSRNRGNWRGEGRRSPSSRPTR